MGNNFQCNDYTALLHHAVSTDTEELMADVLGVEVFRSAVADQSLVGTYSLFTNAGLFNGFFFAANGKKTWFLMIEVGFVF